MLTKLSQTHMDKISALHIQAENGKLVIMLFIQH